VTLRIYGAGMSGLMAAQIMRRHRPVVFEAQTELPDNHGALLRFRSNVVGKAVGQKLQRVEVQKAVMVGGILIPDYATLADANRYSLKVTGEARGRSILNLTGGERFIAPDDFIRNMSLNVEVRLEAPLTVQAVETRDSNSDPIISTIPMPALAEMVGWNKIDFHYRSIWSVRACLLYPSVNLYQTIYYPERESYYRASITGRQVILEYAQEPSRQSQIDDDVSKVLYNFGIDQTSRAWERPTIKFQKYGKLLPIPEEERQRFILAMSDRHAIYSLGRFATWRQILLDDVVHDVEVIDNFITQRSSFSRQKHYNGR
jgi:hypothetical protein